MELMENKFIEQDRYERAKKRVKDIKGFYSHALVYVVVNIMIVILNVHNLNDGESYFHWQNFTTLFFWGIGLLAHAASVFVPRFVLGKDWEEQKIKQLMEKEKNSRWE